MNRARVLSLIALILNKLLLTRTICLAFHSDALDRQKVDLPGEDSRKSGFAEYIG